MRLEATPAPSATDVIDWVLAQPLAIVLLIAAIVWLVRELKQERARGDKLQQTVDTLSAGLNNATDALRKFAEEEKVSVALIQGIDKIRSQRGERR